MGCKHKWEVLDKTILPSPYEQLTSGSSIKKGNLYFFQKKVIVIVSCTKCGKIKTWTESLFEE